METKNTKTWFELSNSEKFSEDFPRFIKSKVLEKLTNYVNNKQKKDILKMRKCCFEHLEIYMRKVALSQDYLKSGGKVLFVQMNFDDGLWDLDGINDMRIHDEGEYFGKFIVFVPYDVWKDLLYSTDNHEKLFEAINNWTRDFFTLLNMPERYFDDMLFDVVPENLSEKSIKPRTRTSWIIEKQDKKARNYFQKMLGSFRKK